MSDPANPDVGPLPVRRRILLVEDEADHRTTLTHILEAYGYSVAAVAHGREALDYLRREPPPDLILLDLAMPFMNGWDFRRAQRADPVLAGIPVVVLSVHGDAATPNPDLGDVGYLTKPVNPVDLDTTLARFMAPRRPEVLVVEDEPVVLQMLTVVLHHYGFTVRQARGGSEALALFRQHGDTIDVVLLDVQMPGTDGPHTLAMLQALDPGVRAVFMSGNTGSYTADDLRRGGAIDVLQKPFTSLSDLTRVLWHAAQCRRVAGGG